MCRASQPRRRGGDDDATVARPLCCADRHGPGNETNPEVRCHADLDSGNKKRGWWPSGDGSRDAPRHTKIWWSLLGWRGTETRRKLSGWRRPPDPFRAAQWWRMPPPPTGTRGHVRNRESTEFGSDLVLGTRGERMVLRMPRHGPHALFFWSGPAQCASGTKAMPDLLWSGVNHSEFPSEELKIWVGG